MTYCYFWLTIIKEEISKKNCFIRAVWILLARWRIIQGSVSKINTSGRVLARPYFPTIPDSKWKYSSEMIIGKRKMFEQRPLWGIGILLVAFPSMHQFSAHRNKLSHVQEHAHLDVRLDLNYSKKYVGKGGNCVYNSSIGLPVLCETQGLWLNASPRIPCTAAI